MLVTKMLVTINYYYILFVMNFCYGIILSIFMEDYFISKYIYVKPVLL